MDNKQRVKIIVTSNISLRDVDINCEWPGILYGLCKVHKAITDICPPFRPILSAIGTPSYKLAKFLVPKLSSITFNEFTVKDSFAFAEEIVHQDSKLSMGILDVDSLFTNIPLEETINICTNLLYDNEDVIEGVNKSEFKNLLSLATRLLRSLLFRQTGIINLILKSKKVYLSNEINLFWIKILVLLNHFFSTIVF